jgi:8-oxo-dGTP diphosphatase
VSDYLEPRFCIRCGTGLQATIVHGESAWACGQCGHRHFRRPTVGVAGVLVEDAGVLLVQRGYGARAGLWCIPCGHVGWDEDVRHAAEREMLEETGLTVQLSKVLAVQSNFWRPERQTVGVWFTGRRLGGVLRAGDDAVDARFFALDRLPELAFSTDETVLDMLRSADRASP